jgi:hypothetical protein
MPYTVEYGSRSYGNDNQQFDELDDALSFAVSQDAREEIDFVTIYDSEGEEIPYASE